MRFRVLGVSLFFSFRDFGFLGFSMWGLGFDLRMTVANSRRCIDGYMSALRVLTLQQYKGRCETLHPKPL